MNKWILFRLVILVLGILATVLSVECLIDVNRMGESSSAYIGLLCGLCLLKLACTDPDTLN